MCLPMRHCSCLTPSYGHWQSIAQTGTLPYSIRLPLVHGDGSTTIGSRCSGLCNTYGGRHAPNDTPLSPRHLRDLTGSHDSLRITASACSPCLRPAADKAYQPGNQRNRHSRAAHRTYGHQPSTPNQILGEGARTHFDPEAAPTDSKATEPSHRIHRSCSIRLLTYQLRANTHTVATKRYRDISIQGVVIA